MFRALDNYCSLRSRQGNYSGAVIFAEEGYNLVVEAYNCVHPRVQEAAGTLIKLLMEKGDLIDLENASRYAEITYSNLRDKTNGGGSGE